MRCLLLVLTLAVALASCGDSPTAPSAPPPIPQVAGTYTGPATFMATGIGLSEDGTGSIVVTQAGAAVTIVGSWTFLGQTSHDPSISGTIDATGRFTRSGGEVQAPGPDADFDENCGNIMSRTLTAVFSGNTVRYSDTEQTELCGQLGIPGHSRADHDQQPPMEARGRCWRGADGPGLRPRGTLRSPVPVRHRCRRDGGRLAALERSTRDMVST